jgi:hypothetical protein
MFLIQKTEPYHPVFELANGFLKSQVMSVDI